MSEVRYDPQTGLPIEEPKIVGYDPQTGEPVYGEQAPQITGYDPQTGEPVYGQPGPQVQPMPQNFSAGQQAKPKKGKAPLIIGVIVAAVLVVALLSVVVVKSGLFFSKNTKVLAALNSTLKSNEVVKVLNLMPYVESGSYTLEADGRCKGYAEVSGSIIVQTDIDKKKLSAQVEGNVYGTKANADLYMDNKMIYADIPMLCNDGLVYKFNGAKDGYLMRMLYQNSDMDEDSMKAVDDYMSGIFDQAKTSQEYAKKYKKTFLDWFGNLDCEKASEKKWEVDGKKKSCKGYTIVIDSNDMEDLLEDIKDLYMQQVDDMKVYDILDEIDSYQADYMKQEIENSFDDMIDELDYMGKIKLTFYLSSGKVAAVSIESDVMEGDVMEGDIMFPTTDKIKSTWYVNGQSADLNLQYDKKEEELMLSIGAAGRNYDFICNATNTGKDFEIELDKVDIPGVGYIDGTFRLTKGTSIKTPNVKDALDIGTATQRDLSKIKSIF